MRLEEEFVESEPTVTASEDPITSDYLFVELAADAATTTQDEITQFHDRYIGKMDLYADVDRVANYLDEHQGWFQRCARPFKADPLGRTGYAMGVGRVGAFGFQVDPRVGLELHPSQNGIYRISTVPIPDQEPQGYEVDFRAEMRLCETPLAPQDWSGHAVMTSVEWTLNLTVTLQFPPFILRLGRDKIQKTGNGVLAFIVKRVSRSLTAKVQDDFHNTAGIVVPPRRKR